MFKISIYQICMAVAITTSSFLNGDTIHGSAMMANKIFTEPLKVMGTFSGDGIKAPSLTVHGKADLKNSTFDEATIHGKCEVSKSTINGPLTIKGRADLDKVVTEKLVVHGRVELNESSVAQEALIHGRADMDNTTLTGPVTIHGGLKAKKTDFKSSLTVESTKIELINSTAQDILIILHDPNEVSSFWRAVQAVNDFFKSLFWTPEEEVVPTVILKGDTIVHGSITFKNGTGIVAIHDSARVAGTVTGAQIKKV